jgi:hypothetical protein
MASGRLEVALGIEDARSAGLVLELDLGRRCSARRVRRGGRTPQGEMAVGLGRWRAAVRPRG